MLCLKQNDTDNVSCPYLVSLPNDDSSYVPRICWGKYYQIDNEYYIDFNIQVSHALVDGYPLSLAFLEIEKYLNSPKKYIDESRENA